MKRDAPLQPISEGILKTSSRVQDRRSPLQSSEVTRRYDTMRRLMVEGQLRARGILDERVLTAMAQVPRHRFVDEALYDRAYGDHPLPLGAGQTVSQPYMVGRMIELLELTGMEKVLEIGTGSGYQTAVLAELARRVCSVERIKTLAERAWTVLTALRCRNVVIRQADGTYGWEDEAPFDAIIVSAGAPMYPPPLIDQLKIGGRIVIPIGDKDGQMLQKGVKHAEGLTHTPLIPCVFVPLVGAWGHSEKS